MSVRVRLAAAVVVVTAGLGAGVHGQPAPEKKPNEVRQHYTKYEHRIPMRDGAKPLHVGLRAEDVRRPAPDPAEAHAVLGGALRRRPVPREHRPVRALHEGRLHRRLPGRARALHVGGHVGGGAAAQPGEGGPPGHRREHRHLGHDRLAGQARAVQQRPRRHVGHLVPRLLRLGRHDRRAPGAQGRLAAGAGDRLLPGRRLVPQRRLHAGRELRVLHRLQAAAGRAAAAGRRACRFDYGTPSGYEFYLRMGPLWSGAERYGLLDNLHYRINLEHTTYDDFWRARSIWRHFKQHHAGRAHRRRLVRRRGPDGSAAHLPDDPRGEPDDRQPPRDGAVDARQLGARRGVARGQPRLRPADRRVLPRAHRVPVLHARTSRGEGGRLPGRPAGAPLDVRDRHEPLAHVRRVAAGRRRARTLYLRGEGRLATDAPAEAGRRSTST